jgi:hypothetical protein
VKLQLHPREDHLELYSEPAREQGRVDVDLCDVAPHEVAVEAPRDPSDDHLAPLEVQMKAARLPDEPAVGTPRVRVDEDREVE